MAVQANGGDDSHRAQALMRIRKAVMSKMRTRPFFDAIATLIDAEMTLGGWREQARLSTTLRDHALKSRTVRLRR